MAKKINSPHILTRSDGNWTHTAQAKGIRHKGLEYKMGTMPTEVWEAGIIMSKDENYWRNNDYAKFKKWCKDNPGWQ